MRVGERYLIFASVRPDGSLEASAASVFELLRSQSGLPYFQSLMPTETGEPPNEIQALLPDEVFDRIERRL